MNPEIIEGRVTTDPIIPLEALPFQPEAYIVNPTGKMELAVSKLMEAIMN